MIVANQETNVLEVESLGWPIETSIMLALIPALKSLTRLVEDFSLYAILQSDQHESVVSFIDEEIVSESVTVVSSDDPRKQARGALNQRRYQVRVNERVQASAKRIADEPRSGMRETGARRLTRIIHETLSQAFDMRERQ